ncbi:uncharacterized protein LOC111409320 isoform X2 [Olea europaea var. sylvestris]|uniref:uncharacterized protein LOC111409320 isoform X2 n=1 Tax=Olea europaea var. sylvestris TaxID=158386 RepID=UPI000C1D8B98|nr:uncharacterized protein LOC111409320 isoform X2 [Olea europaea var. sylvestris]
MDRPIRCCSISNMTVSLFIDAVISVRHRKLWFPCRFSSLNAASLTVLAVAVKLSMDLTTPMKGVYDQAAKITSTAFLCVSTTHFMPSLGSMSDRDIIVNLTALGILIVTLTVNVIIQAFTRVIEDVKQVVIVCMNIYAFIVLISSALTVFTSKRYLERKYKELQTRILAAELQGDQIMDFEKLKLCVKKYWVMTETGNPQFVMVRSEASVVLFMICVLTYISERGILYGGRPTASDYKWSVYFVYWTQYVGMILCTVMSLGRLLVALIHTVRNIRHCTICSISLEIKNYRIKRLVEWKRRLPPLYGRGQKHRKIIYHIRNLLINICIGSQIVIVILNKFLLPISIGGIIFLFDWNAASSATLIIPLAIAIVLFFGILRMRIIRCLVMVKFFFSRQSEASANPNEAEHAVGYEQDLRNFVLHLESEAINDGYLTFINTSINSSVKMGAKHQPRYLTELMENSTSFEGVSKFESDQVSPIICIEPLNCWSLAVATLTSITIALPNVQNEKRNQLLRGVTEGFKYVRLTEKSLDVHKKLVSSTRAADFAWILVELRRKWLDMDLQKIARVSKSSKETLQNLANRSEEILKEFTSSMNGNAMESLVDLPENIIIANSMYKISNSLLLVHEESYHSASDTQVFERFSVIVADIFAACLTNLPQAILKKCNNSAIEEREKIIKEATHLLRETQEIMKALHKREIPNLSLNQSIYIDEWRTLLKHPNHGTLDSTPSSENIITALSGEVHLDIQELRASATPALETDEGNAGSHISGEVEESGEEKENHQT